MLLGYFVDNSNRGQVCSPSTSSLSNLIEREPLWRSGADPGKLSINDKGGRRDEHFSDFSIPETGALERQVNLLVRVFRFFWGFS